MSNNYGKVYSPYENLPSDTEPKQDREYSSPIVNPIDNYSPDSDDSSSNNEVFTPDGEETISHIHEYELGEEEHLNVERAMGENVSTDISDITSIDEDNKDIIMTNSERILSDKLNLVINSHRLIIDRMDTFLDNQEKIMESIDAGSFYPARANTDNND